MALRRSYCTSRLTRPPTQRRTTAAAKDTRPTTTSAANHGATGRVRPTSPSSITTFCSSGANAMRPWPTTDAPSATTTLRRWAPRNGPRRRIHPPVATGTGTGRSITEARLTTTSPAPTLRRCDAAQRRRRDPQWVMPEIRETKLPGVGIEFDFTSESGDHIGVISRHSGRRELVLYAEDDPDAVRNRMELTPTEGAAVAELLGGTQVTAHLAALSAEIEGLFIDWVPLGPSFVPTSIADTAMRTRTGSSVIAIIRRRHRRSRPWTRRRAASRRHGGVGRHERRHRRRRRAAGVLIPVTATAATTLFAASGGRPPRSSSSWASSSSCWPRSVAGRHASGSRRFRRSSSSGCSCATAACST